MIKYFVDAKPSTDCVSVKVEDDGELIGLAYAYGDSISMTEVGYSYHCDDDLIDISYEYPQVMDGEYMRILEVNNAKLKNDYHRQGIGKLMYHHLMMGFHKKIKKPFVMIPDQCSSGQTSHMARRVWNSLKKQYPSSGYCLVIDL